MTTARLSAKGYTGTAHPWQSLVFLIMAVVGVALAYLEERHPQVIALALLPAVFWLVVRPYGIFSLGLLLLMAVPTWWTVGSAQASVMRVVVLCCLAAILTRRSSPPRWRFVDVALSMYVAVFVLDWLLGFNQPHVGRVVSVVMTPLGVYIGARFTPRERIPQLMGLCAIFGALGALTVVYEALVGHSVFIDSTKYSWNALPTTIFRPGGVFGSPPAAGAMMSFAILFGVGSLRAVSAKMKRVVIASCLLCAVALVLTFTRASLVGTAVGLLVCVVLLRPHWAHPLPVAWACVMVAAFTWLAIPSVSSSRVFQEGILRSGTLAERQQFWAAALPIVEATPGHVIFGMGTGALEAPGVSSAVDVPSTIASAPIITEISLQNQYVTTFFEQGLIGLVALLAFLFATTVPVGAHAFRKRDPVTAALAASGVSIAMIMFVDTGLVVNCIFSLTLAMAAFGAILTAPNGHPTSRI